jgi:hypothetical protein
MTAARTYAKVLWNLILIHRSPFVLEAFRSWKRGTSHVYAKDGLIRRPA